MKERQINLDLARKNGGSRQGGAGQKEPENTWTRAPSARAPRVPVQQRTAGMGPAAPRQNSRRPIRQYVRRKRRHPLRTLVKAICLGAVCLGLCIGAYRGMSGLLGTTDGSLPAMADALSSVSETAETVWEPAGPPYVIAIDAGHGGIDRGAEGYVVEYEMTEGTTDELVALLEADPNYTPVRTRQNGEGMSVRGRAEAAAAAGAAILLSIHGNSDETGTAVGFECYPQTPGLPYHSYSLKLAHSIADRIAETGQTLRGEAGVRYTYYEGSEEEGYGKILVEESDTSVYDLPTFGVLEYAACPAVLVEQCFLTHAGDAADWASPSGWRLAAECYYKAICDFFGTEPIALDALQ